MSPEATQWVAMAQDAMTRWAQRNRGEAGTFEQLRAHVERRLEPPIDGRHWGSVATALLRDGVLSPTDLFAGARSSNGAPKRIHRVL